MSNIYTDYINKVAIQVPERFIDVKTGESYGVSAKLIEQLDFHSNNHTLHHLVFSALHHYLSPRPNGGNAEILHQLSEIKSILAHGAIKMPPSFSTILPSAHSDSLDMKEVEEVLEAFGG